MKTCGECGSRRLVAFADKTLLAGDTRITDLSGMRCAECDETYLVADSQARYAAALDAAVLAQRQVEQTVRRKP